MVFGAVLVRVAVAALAWALVGRTGIGVGMVACCCWAGMLVADKVLEGPLQLQVVVVVKKAAHCHFRCVADMPFWDLYICVYVYIFTMLMNCHHLMYMHCA